MAKGKITYVNLTPADNGIILTWSEKIENKKNPNNSFDNCSYVDHSLVFDTDKGEDPLDEAFAKFRELWTLQMNQKQTASYPK